MVKQLRKWLEEEEKAWKPKQELATMEKKTDFVTQMVDTAEIYVHTDLIYSVEAFVQTILIDIVEVPVQTDLIDNVEAYV